MIICADLFTSEELRAWALANRAEGCCAVSGKTVSLIDTSGLAEYFQTFFSLFEKTAEGSSLSEIVQTHWNLFAQAEQALPILSGLLHELGIDMTAETKVRYKALVMEPCDRWAEIKRSLKTERRFFAGDLIQDEDKWDVFFASNYTIKKGTLYRRARINEDEKQLYSKESELGMPPADCAPAGRANTYGIPYLYLGDDELTVMYESRALANDILSVASYRTTEDIDVVDFTFKPDLFGSYQRSEEDFLSDVQRYVFLNEVAEDLSKAIRRYDNKQIDYLPTQFVCEYIRLVTAAKGLIFRSSQYPEGKNIVLFNDKKVRFERVEHRVVGKVKMQYAGEVR